MTQYYLPHHVHFGCRGDRLVFVDLKHDDYVLVSGEGADAVRALAPHGKIAASPSEDGTQELDTALNELVVGGLLTTHREAGRTVEPARVAMATDTLIDAEESLSCRVTMQHAYRFAISCASAAAMLRFQTIEQIVTGVRRRKARFAHTDSVELESARYLTAIFHRLRSYFPRNYLCLYDSLALIEFLARYRVFPEWVFAVRLEPWGAHCWVQQARFTFNEDVEEAAAYTPVMVV